MPKPTDEILEELDEELDEDELEDEDLDDEDDEEQDGSEDEVSAAQQAYIARMKSMGALFNEKNEFIGWGSSGLQPQPKPQADDDDDLDQRLNQRDAAIIAATRPASVDAAVGAVVALNPAFNEYAGMVKAALITDQTAPLDPNSVTSLFYFFRGQAADVEIAKATAGLKKKAAKTATKVKAGSAAGSDGGGTKGAAGRGVKNAPITPEIEMAAKAWGLDPQKYANKIAESKGRK